MGDMDKKPLYPGWETVRKIGTGSFGTVYEIERDLFGKKEKAALKLISIPQYESDIDELYGDGFDDASITAHFHNYLADIVKEYSLMAEMKGHTNVVYCDDIRYVQHDDGFGWDIYIKMELLTPMMKTLGKEVSDEEVIKLGRDICNALVLCKSRNIIHRDIKPQNIFISKDGDYKLRDFGIAKTAEKTSSRPKIGTYNYMAPEVYNNEPYGHAADIYSLGLVMYWLLNERRMPFNPLPPAVPTASEMDEARLRRFQGEPVPAPAHGSEALKQIVLKACAYDPKDRYQSAAEMLSALESIGKPAGQEPVFPAQPAEEDDDPTEGFGWKAKAPEPEEEKTVGAWTKQKNEPEPEEEKTVSAWGKKETDKTANGHGTEGDPKKKEYISIIAACLVLLLLAGIAGIAGIAISKKTSEAINRTVVETDPIITESETLPLSDNSTNQIKLTFEMVAAIDKTVGYTYSDIATIQNDGTVRSVGSNEFGQGNVDGWQDIVQISGGNCHFVALKRDGTVLSTGDNTCDQLNTSDWVDIVYIDAGQYSSSGVTSTGDLVTTNEYRERTGRGWSNLTAVSESYYHRAALRADGTVVAGGNNAAGQCDVGDWTDIIQVVTGFSYTAGLKSDGTVVTAGNTDYVFSEGTFDTSTWTDVVFLCDSMGSLMGIKSDGSVLYTGAENPGFNSEEWTGIVCAFGSNASYNFIGLKNDGSVVKTSASECPSDRIISQDDLQLYFIK